MTSMPASRSARAITFAPRSWPSRPGLAMTTRIFRMDCLDRRDFRVFAPYFAQGVAHLTHCGIRTHALEQRIHGVLAPARGAPERVQRSLHFRVVTRLLQLRQARELHFRRGIVDVEDRVRG